ncbi:leucine-rich repeat-containing protein 9 [Octopus bimaculoides]|uniref:leucine-rich repeat-containing protein 9 n=1 Tax=Octopus bimaculoides TaxID=37653 RepID=UPI00071C482B|nr:leucine-rich repeat-containing protein 9 [Octopus bimaculoides]|eukprot:XP_014790953.1 PREDICTED: leucine-rich repeat-containing protein 9-like [Octopus bimaculoides]
MDAKNYKEEHQLEEVCTANGLSYAHVREEGKYVQELEMFFSGLTNIQGFQHFPNLQRLVIVQQCIECTHGLRQLPNLQELWLCQCGLKKISNLDKCCLLTKLYLYNNQIKKIEHLEKLKKLQVLWLNNNCISIIENLFSLKYLRELNLADNKIIKIGKGLQQNINLENLNLSANKITFLKDLSPLCQLPHLENLSLKDPNYLPSPVSLLWNYSIFVIYRIPHLLTLDTYNVSSPEIVQAVEATIEKKVIFYDSKKKELEYKKHCWLDAALNLRTRLLTGYYMYVEQLARLLQMIENIPLLEVEKHTRQKTIQVTLEKCEAKYQRVILKFKEAMFFMEKSYNFGLYMVDTELITCGNVKFEEPTLTDSWYDCCCDMILDNFCKWDFQQLDICGIDVLSVFKVTNRAVNLRFDNYLMSLVSLPDEGYNLTDQLHEFKNKQDYLFWMPNENSDGYLLEKILQDGFSFSRYAQAQNEDNAIKLYNCLYFADLQRLKNLGMQNHTESEDSFQIKYGKLLICRVFTGNPVEIEDDKKINPANYPQFTSFYKTKKTLLKQSGFLYSVNDHPACRCLQNQREWHIYNPGLIVPEYVVKFKYNLTDEIMNPFLQLKEPYQDVSEEVERKFLSQWISLNENTYIQEMIKNLTEEVYETYNKSYTDGNIESSLLSDQNLSSTITHLNLSRQNLNKLNIAKLLPSLVKLEASFNNFTSLDLVYPSLEYVDVSFNKISTLEGLKNLPNLEYFDLSWNCLIDFSYSLNVLKQNAINLHKLNVSYNHWHEPSDLRIQLLFYLKNLEAINGIEVSNDERQRVTALTKRYQTRLALLKRRSRLDIRTPRILSLHNKAQVLVESSKCVFQTMDITEEQMFLKITSLCLDHCYLQDLSIVGKLLLLRWLSLDGNQLTTLQNLKQCLCLEEISAANNCINQLGDISQLVKLQKLHLSHNYLDKLNASCLTNLAKLSYLSLENNLFTSLENFNKLTNLQHLYLTNNKIANPREIISVKNLKNLTIAHFSGNPMIEEHEDYRFYVIFHLRGLHLLDDIPVDSSQVSAAKDIFGGCLTLDLITERFGSISNELQELNLPNSSIRTVVLGFADTLCNLTSINLENNCLTSFCGLIYLDNLKVLCLNNNRVECIVSPSPKFNPNKNKQKTDSTEDTYGNLSCSSEEESTYLKKLEILHLGYNEIKSLAQLQLFRLPSLRALFLQGNEIMKVDGIEQLTNLSELILDANKIRTLSPQSFSGQLNLLELHLEENRLVSLAALGQLTKLQRLYVGSNKIQEVQELEHLKSLESLTEISLANNSISKKPQMRHILISQSPMLTAINGNVITEEDRIKAEAYFMERIGQCNSLISSQTNVSENILPMITPSTMQLNCTSSKQSIPHITVSIGTNFNDITQTENQEKH